MHRALFKLGTMAAKKRPKINKTLSEEQWKERGYGSVKLRVRQEVLEKFTAQAQALELQRHQYLAVLVDAVDRGDFKPGVEAPPKKRRRS